jgi:hypothetical protein
MQNIIMILMPSNYILLNNYIFYNYIKKFEENE